MRGVDRTQLGPGERWGSGKAVEAAESFPGELGAPGCAAHERGSCWGRGGGGWFLLPKSSCHHGQSLLAPRGLFEAETTRGCAKDGC